MPQAARLKGRMVDGVLRLRQGVPVIITNSMDDPARAIGR